MSQGGLIEGIAQDAEAEAGRILAEAEKSAAERQQAAAQQAEGILEEAARKAAEQAEGLKRQIASAEKMEVKRIGLRVREEAIRQVLERTRARLEGLLGTPEYAEVLTAWIAEAAVGLGLPEATVHASAAEMPAVDQRLLAEAQARVLESTGRGVRLTRGEPLPGQGVVLVGREGRLAYNNQVSTRLLRLQTQIRKAIYEALWKSES